VRRVAFLLSVVVLAGCGSHPKQASPPTVAGTETTQNFLTPSFKAAANSQARQISAFVVDLKKNLAANVQVSGSLLRANCIGAVNSSVSRRAKSGQEKQVARALVTACQDLDNAIAAAKQGKSSRAEQLASQALAQAKLAANASS
jgi:hypothetical protein